MKKAGLLTLLFITHIQLHSADYLGTSFFKTGNTNQNAPQKQAAAKKLADFHASKMRAAEKKRREEHHQLKKRGKLPK